MLVSHRGNLIGPNPERENHPDYIRAAWAAGFDVEVDVWLVDGHPVLGHDKPLYEVDSFFICDSYYCWFHAKNIDALSFLLEAGAHCFWHQTDDAVLTSKQYIWTFPGKPLTTNSIAVLPERVPEWDISGCCGVCSDFIKTYEKI